MKLCYVADPSVQVRRKQAGGFQRKEFSEGYEMRSLHVLHFYFLSLCFGFLKKIHFWTIFLYENSVSFFLLQFEYINVYQNHSLKEYPYHFIDLHKTNFTRNSWFLLYDRFDFTKQLFSTWKLISAETSQIVNFLLILSSPCLVKLFFFLYN